MANTKQQSTAELKAAFNPAESQSLPAQSSFDSNHKPHSAAKTSKQSKKQKHQQKLARLVANTFGPDSLDLFKSTMSAAAAVESAVSAHAIAKSLTSSTKKKVSCAGDSAVGSESSHNNSPRVSTASPLTAAFPTGNGNRPSMSQGKTTSKLNRKFNLLQRKIASLIESNNLEPFALMAPEVRALAKAAPAKSQTDDKGGMSKEDESLSGASSAGATKTDLAVNVKNDRNVLLEDDEVSEVGTAVCRIIYCPNLSLTVASVES